MHILAKAGLVFLAYQLLKPSTPQTAEANAADAARLKAGLTDAAARVTSAISASGIELSPTVQAGVTNAVDALTAAAAHAGQLEQSFAGRLQPSTVQNEAPARVTAGGGPNPIHGQHSYPGRRA